MKKVLLLVSLVFLVNLFFGCEENLDNILGSVTDSIELTDQQQMDLVSLGLADPSGGVMSLLQVASSSIDPSFYSLGKLDTSFTHDWVTYDLTFSFFSQNEEVSGFSPDVDSVTCGITMSGNHTFQSPSENDAEWQVRLGTAAGFQVKQFTASEIRLHGSGVDTSHYVYSKNGVALNVDSNSDFQAANVVIPLSDVNHVPTSGQLSGSVAGKAFTDNLTKNFNIPYTAQFTGNNEVVVTLTSSGEQFTVNLLTGAVTKN